MFVGICNFSLQDPGVNEFVERVTQQMKETEMEINARAIANTMYYMRHYHSRKNTRMIGLLQVINQRLAVCPDYFSARELNSATFGLRHLSDCHPEVQVLLVHVLP